MKKIWVKPLFSREKSLELIGTFANQDCIKTLIQEDCDVFCEESGEPLLFLRKNVASFELAKKAYHALRSAATKSSNRGAAADGESGYVKGNTRYYKPVSSGIIGYYDRYIRIPYCRKTAFNEKQLEKFKAGFPYIKLVDQIFKECVPKRYSAQLEAISRTHPDFYIKDTVFTTVTVNKNYRTALHVDKGDLEAGFGNLGVLAAGSYGGAYTVMPRYGIGVDVRSRDISCFDVHQVHGNTEFIGKEGNYERISIVCYYREKMHECGSAAEELEIAKNRKRGDPLY